MDPITIREPYKHPEGYLDREMQVGGWVRSLCDPKFFGFIVVSDGSCFEILQVVYHDNLSNSVEVSESNVSTTIIVKGTLVATPDAKQPFEIQAAKVTVEGTSVPDHPLQKERHPFEYLRSISHLRPGTNTFQAVFRIRSLIAHATHQYFQEQDFVYVRIPLITGSDCEDAGEMFQVTTLGLNNIPKTDGGKVGFSQDFFNKSTDLTVSGQLNAETYATTFHSIYTFGPTFRAENSNTARHAAKFWTIEPGTILADLDDNVYPAEGMPRCTIKYVLEHAPEEMSSFNQFMDKGLLERLNDVLSAELGHITYTDAAEFLEKHNDEFDYRVFWGYDLQTKHERCLTKKVFKKPMFITDYPKEIKASYTKMNPDNKTVAAVDCPIPGTGGIIGGGQREDSLERLVARMDELDLNKGDYGFYLDLCKYDSTHHAGFGLGFGRCAMYLIGMSNIRDVIPLPRTIGNYEL